MIEVVEMIGFIVMVVGLLMFLGHEIQRGIDTYDEE
tara:strand:- start:10 stop:117 length:108 start_codon:yes stop_codon:yes gene_type:complete